MFIGANTQDVIEIAKANGGIITSSEVTSQKLQRYMLSDAVKDGKLIKLDRGLYCLPETWSDEYVIAQHRFGRGIFSHDTALYLLELSDQAPEALTMSFPRGYNPSAAKKAGIITKASPEGAHDAGIAEALTPYGNKVRIYNAERTLCDMLRGTATPDKQLFNPALRAYFSSSKRSVPALLEYAKALGVEKKMRTYLEVLL